MAWYSAFTRTGGISNAFVSTTGRQTLFVCGGTYSAFTATTGSQVYFNSAGTSVVFAATTANAVFPLTAGMYSVFTTTVEANPDKLLVLQNGDFVFGTNYTSVTIADTTGVYDEQTNPNGYQPPLDPPDPLRPYRSDLKLWTIYRVKTSSTPDLLIFPTSQANESEAEYTYTLTIPESGVYELIMIGAPDAEDYENWNQDNLVDYARSQSNWFATSVWVTIDPALDKCLANYRWAFLESVMCGNCDTSYLAFYADYVALYYANQVQNATVVNDLYTKLTAFCSGSDCGCCGCYSPYSC
jgi:hypothetical protein